jgi:hypothetical protein
MRYHQPFQGLFVIGTRYTCDTSKCQTGEYVMGLLIIFGGWCPGILYCGANAKCGKIDQAIGMRK